MGGISRIQITNDSPMDFADALILDNLAFSSAATSFGSVPEASTILLCACRLRPDGMGAT